MQQNDNGQMVGSQTLGTIDDVLAALSAIRGSVHILAKRGRGKLGRADLDELERILAAAERIQRYNLTIRASVSAAYQEQLKR